METETFTLSIPTWAKIGNYIEVRMYDPNYGKFKWFREKIIAYSDSGFFQQSYDHPVYHKKFSDFGTEVRTCEQKFDYDMQEIGSEV